MSYHFHSFKKTFLLSCFLVLLGAVSSLFSDPVAPVGTSVKKTGVTVGQYAAFLNAVAKTDTYHLYHPSMGTEGEEAFLIRSGSPGKYRYRVVPGKEDSLVTYVSWISSLRFCNWKEHQQPVGDQGPETTEAGSYDLSLLDEGDTESIVSLQPAAGVHFFIPSDYLIDTRFLEDKTQTVHPFAEGNTIGFSIAEFVANRDRGAMKKGGSQGSFFQDSTLVKGMQEADVTSSFTSSSMPLLKASLAVPSTGSNAETVTDSNGKLKISLVPVLNPGNPADASGFGAVATGYQIGMYDVTVEQYCVFLNAVAKKDPHQLYNTNMTSDENAPSIKRTGTLNNYSYEVLPGCEKLPMTHVGWFSAIRFCNWLQNGQPQGVQDGTTTESGSLNLTTGTNIPGALWGLPTEDQWYKAAYYVAPSKKNDVGSYVTFGTASNVAPTNKYEEAVVANTANYSLNGVPSTSMLPHLTPVGIFANSASPYGIYDMAGNVSQWTSSYDATGNNIIVRGGSWKSESSDELTSSSRFTNSVLENATTGFRVVYNASPALPISKITIDLVPVGNPGNAADTMGKKLGSVPMGYQIGKYDVTAEQYCMFLNAVAKKDRHALYNTNMATDLNVATIVRSGEVDNYSYSVIPGREKLPITYVNFFAAIRFCNWLENGQPVGEQTLETTEGGTFNPDTNNAYGAVTPGSKWCLPTENQWYKAAYYKPVTEAKDLYWRYGTANNEVPGNQLADAANPNQVNYALNEVYTTSTLPRLTPVGMFTTSASAYGAYDMAGNVYQWTLGVAEDQKSLIVRGGSWASKTAEELAFSALKIAPGDYASSLLGFRVVYNVAPKIVVPTTWETVTKQAELVRSTVWGDIKEFPTIFTQPGTYFFKIMYYTIGGGIGEIIAKVFNGCVSFLHWLFTDAFRSLMDLIGNRLGESARGLMTSLEESLEGVLNFLIAKMESGLGQETVSSIQAWAKKIYDFLLAPIKSRVLPILQATERELQVDQLRETFRCGVAQARLRALGYAPNAGVVGENAANGALIEAGGVGAEVVEAFALNAEADAALALTNFAMANTTAAIAAEAGAVAVFSSPAAAIIIPVVLLIGSYEALSYSKADSSNDPRIAIGLAIDAVFRYAIPAIKLLF